MNLKSIFFEKIPEFLGFLKKKFLDFFSIYLKKSHKIPEKFPKKSEIEFFDLPLPLCTSTFSAPTYPRRISCVCKCQK